MQLFLGMSTRIDLTLDCCIHLTGLNSFHEIKFPSDSAVSIVSTKGCCGCLVVCPTLSHGLQHTRFLCPLRSLSLLKFMCTEPVMVSNHLTLFPFCLQSFQALGSFQMTWLFTLRWPKYWSFSLSICPSNKYPGLISFRIGWFEHLTI